MDSVFGIGAPELIFILLLAGIVMGPQRIRQVALWLGKTTAQLQSISRGFARQLNAELDAVDGSGDIRGAMNEMQDLRRQVRELRQEVTSAAISPVRQSEKMIRETKEAVERSIAPPHLQQDGASLPPANNETPADTEPDTAGHPADAAETAPAAAPAASTPAALPNLVEVADDPE